VPMKTKCSRSHVGNAVTDCVPQTMFELGYLSEDAARHLSEAVGCHLGGYGNGTRKNIILDLLDAKYEGCIHAFTSFGVDLKEYLPNKMSTIGILSPNGAEEGHAVIVFRFADKIRYMDGQRCESQYAIHEFDDAELKRLRIVYVLPDILEDGSTSNVAVEPIAIHEVTYDMIDTIVARWQEIEEPTEGL